MRYRVLLYQKSEIHNEKYFVTSDQSVSKNSLVRPSFPRDFSLGILFKASNSSFSVIHFSHSRDCLVDNLGNLEIVFKKVVYVMF